MPSIVHKSDIPASPASVFDWISKPGSFQRLQPPYSQARILSDGGLADESRRVVALRRWPFPLGCETRVTDAGRDRGYTEQQTRGPFTHWRHEHRIRESEIGSSLEDRIDFDLPMSAITGWMTRPIVERRVSRMLRFQHRRMADDLERHARFAGEGARTIAISGASGLIGRELAAFLDGGGHRVLRLVRHTAEPAADEVYWDPGRGEIDVQGLADVDAVIHLAGAPIAAGRWTTRRKAAIRDSRVDGTRLLAKALAGLPHPPQVLVSASAIGFYGGRGQEPLDESSEPGSGFLPDLCRDWEAACAPAEAAGIRVVNVRCGVVLAARGGALAKMLIPFRLGLGGPVGNGKQGMSWIGLDDMLGVLHHAIFTRGLTGAVNATAPNPVSNREFSSTLARVIGRPSLLPLPSALVGLLFGEMGRTLLLEGAHVLPRKLEASGFSFLSPNLARALEAELGL